MERSQTDTPGPSTPGGDLGPHFTDWREQLRDRVREIRARKLADKRAEESGGDAAPIDLAEQAAAARAEKLRAAREAIESSPVSRDLEPEIAADARRIEQRLEELSEEIHEAADEAAEEESGWDDRIAASASQAEEPEETAVEPIEAEADEPVLDIAARVDDADFTLGNGDRTARRSEIADVVDSLLGGGMGGTGAARDELAAAESSWDAPAATAGELPEWDEEPIEATSAEPEWDEEPVGASSDEPEWQEDALEIVAADDVTVAGEPEEELDEVAAFETAQGRWDEEDGTEAEAAEGALEAPVGVETEVEAAAAEDLAAEGLDADAEEEVAEPEPDPFANAPAWARASFAPRKERSAEPPAAEQEAGIPPELEDVDIPSWALPRPSEHAANAAPADLFAETDEDLEDTAEIEVSAEIDDTAELEAPELGTAGEVEAEEALEVTADHDGEPEEPLTGADPIEELAEEAVLALEEAAAEEFDAEPQSVPDEVDLFAPEEETEAVELFAEEAPSTPLSDLLRRFRGEALEEEPAEDASAEDEPVLATAHESVDDESFEAEAFDDEAIEAEADFELDLAPEAASPEVKPEPDSAIAAAIDAAIQRPGRVERKESPEGDIFLVGEFRTRGRIVPPAFEDAPPKRPAPSRPEPVVATSGSRRRPEPERAPVADAGLFAEEREAVDELDAVAPVAAVEEIDWDLDAPGDPDTILDAQRGDADPSAPVTDRIFSAVADAMVLLTIAFLLAVAGAYAAGAPLVPFVQAAPLPFFLAVLVFGFAYGVFFNGTCGQTLGKMAMRVRVIGGDTFRIGYQRAAQRTLYYTVATLPAGLGLLPALRDPEHRALHDRLSNTRVVKA